MAKFNFGQLLAQTAGETISDIPRVHGNVEKQKEAEQKKKDEDQKKKNELIAKEQEQQDSVLSQVELIQLQGGDTQAAEKYLRGVMERGGSMANLPKGWDKFFIQQGIEQQEQAQQEAEEAEMGKLFSGNIADAGVDVPENLRFQDIDFSGFAGDLGINAESGSTPTGRQETASTLQSLANSASSLQQFGGVDIGEASGDPVLRAKLLELIKGGKLPQSGSASANKPITTKAEREQAKLDAKAGKPEFSEKELKNKYVSDKNRITSDNKKIEKELREWKRIKRSLDTRLTRANAENKAFVEEQLAEHELTRPVKTDILKFGKWKKQFFQSFENGAESKDINAMSEKEVDAEIARLKALE